METIEDEPVTEHDIATWADEAEQGYDVDRLRRRERKPAGTSPGRRAIPMRLDESLLAALGERSKRDHVSRSAVIRFAIYAYVG